MQAGEKLQIASGKTATITIPIPSAMQANAPASIPLWYFDETKGIWKEEGSATKQGNNYVGTVAHFSFWTAGQLGQSVRLDATFKDQAGMLLSNKLVTITSTNYGTSSGYTDSAGTVSGLIPANETLVMKVFDQCNSIIYTQNIGPFSADTNLGNISVTVTASNCTIGTPYITLTLNGVDYSWAYPDSLNAYERDDSVSGYHNTELYGDVNTTIPRNSISFTIVHHNFSPGNYDFGIFADINNSTYTGFYPGNTLRTTVTEYGDVGEYISGTASGQVRISGLTPPDIPFTIAYKSKKKSMIIV